MKRRNFLKSSLLLTGFLGLAPKILNLLNPAQAEEAMDSKITRQDYINPPPPTKATAKKKYDQHVKKLAKVKENSLPNCKNCKQFKPIAAHPKWGKCAMVGATGKPGKFVHEDGWCKVWIINKKAL